MIKMLNAYTSELDNPQKAVQEIMDQVDIKNGLLKNSVALLFCHHKFMELGVMEAVCKSLPFDTLGCTSLYFCMSAKADAPASADKSGQSGQIMLTVTILTSNDIEFATGVSKPLPLAVKSAEERIHELYRNTAAFSGGTPNLAFAFLPTIIDLTIDVMSAALDRASGGIPIFGAVALDMDNHIRNPKTIYKGAAYSDRIALLLFKGPVNPHFCFLRFPEMSSMAQDAVITSASGSQIITINNEPAASFLKEIGLLRNDENDFSHAIPLVVEDSEGGNPEVVVVHSISSEGVLICSRQVMVGGILNIGAITADHVLESAKMLVQEIKEHKSEAGLFIISCFLRSIVLGESAAAEVRLIQEELDNSPIPYLYLNSGGELCPRYRKFGGIANQALQYAIIACRL